MNTRLLVGICISVLIVILFILFYKFNKSKNRTLRRIINIFSSFVALLAEVATILSLIVPGVHLLIDSNSTISVEHNVGSLISENNGSVIIYNYNNSNDETFSELSDSFETVDRFPVGWADSNGGRDAYTIDEINWDALGDRIVFNSISDSTIGHEFNFVGAKKNDGKTYYYNGNEIEVEDDMTYIVRLFVHNNSPKGYERIAEDVKVRFSISNTVKVTSDDVKLEQFNSVNGYYAVAVHGYISSSNADPNTYSDGVKFVSNKPFYLEYIPNTANFFNGAIGENGYSLDDSIVDDYITIGYEKMDGKIPGCYSYTSVTSIIVKPVFL